MNFRILVFRVLPFQIWRSRFSVLAFTVPGFAFWTWCSGFLRSGFGLPAFRVSSFHVPAFLLFLHDCRTATFLTFCFGWYYSFMILFIRFYRSAVRRQIRRSFKGLSTQGNKENCDYP